MASILLSNDTSDKYIDLDKMMVKIVSSKNGLKEEVVIIFNFSEFKDLGVEVYLTFKGNGELDLPTVEGPIISIKKSNLEDGKEVILKLGRYDVKALKILIDHDNNMLLTNMEFKSKDTSFSVKNDRVSSVFNFQDENELELQGKTQEEYYSSDELEEEVISINPNTIKVNKINSNQEDNEEIIEDSNDNVKITTKVDNKKGTIEGKIFYIVDLKNTLPRNVRLNGIRVKLYNEENKLVATRMTRRYRSENGHFRFIGLEEGLYKLKFLIPSNYEIVKGSSEDIINGVAQVYVDSDTLRSLDVGVLKLR